VAPKLVQLANLRNTGGAEPGFENFWIWRSACRSTSPTAAGDLRGTRTAHAGTVRPSQSEHRPPARGPVRLAAEALLPWHYDNPFFQDAPPSDKVDLNEFYQGKPTAEIVEIAAASTAASGLPAEDILRRSDLYEREGKDQHAFCTSIDRAGDVRTLCNVKPTAEWMDTVLHELGHGVYELGIDPALPYNLRMPAHAFTTKASRCSSAHSARIRLGW